MKRWPSWIAESGRVSREKGPSEGFPFELSRHESPMKRGDGDYDPELQRGKENNVALAAKAIDRTVVVPGGLFSYHHLVGRPSLKRGFLKGLELHGGQMAAGVGGGCCMVSNMLYLLALRAGCEIVERHRHALDLFPDHGRTVPYGCGATVFYNMADFRFRNALSQDVMVRLEVSEGKLVGRIMAASDPGFRIEVFETDHAFRKEGGTWYRENKVWRRFHPSDGGEHREELVAHNIGRCLYDPEKVAD